MCAAILVFVGGLVLVASTQAAPLAHVPTPIELDAARPSDWCPVAAGGAGIGTIGETARAIGTGRSAPYDRLPSSRSGRT
jgi:hypothetical protein